MIYVFKVFFWMSYSILNEFCLFCFDYKFFYFSFVVFSVIDIYGMVKLLYENKIVFVCVFLRLIDFNYDDKRF